MRAGLIHTPEARGKYTFCSSKLLDPATLLCIEVSVLLFSLCISLSLCLFHLSRIGLTCCR